MMTIFGLRIVLVDAVPSGWRFWRGRVLLTARELDRVRRDDADWLLEEATAAGAWR